MAMTTNELRQAFIDYFIQNKHHHLESASLVPNDQSLLFTNAGMVPFKPYFLGSEVPQWKRVTSSQRCVRAGGKHNDLENVGMTARHHTFFEMLGNFSFGDYFKSEAIHYAWDFIVNVCQLDPSRLWITVYKDDEESAQIWHNQEGVPTDRIIYCGEASNFWSMGNTGPCGPCTEIFYDHGPDIPGGPPGSKDEDGDRFVEIWNLVFMQYNQNDKGERKPLPAPCVDTGMGLERIAAVVQGVHDNYDTDQFVHLLNAINQLPGANQLRSVSSRVIADHIRSIVFLIADGVVPSNEGRGYVLRRIMRRALCFAYRDGMPLPFLHVLGQFVCREMSMILPKGQLTAKDITAIILNEEKQFDHVIGQGMVYLESYIEKGNKKITGEQAFKLYDTYGFPLDLTLDIAKSQDIEVDEEGFRQCMEQQRNRSRSSQAFADSQLGLDYSEKTDFIGYNQLTNQAKIVCLFDSERNKSTTITVKGQCYLVLDQSVFYPEGGGQVADQGELEAEGVRFKVEDVQKQGDSIILFGTVLEGELTVNMDVTAKVNPRIRKATMRNHSATHLLHAALRQVLGSQVEQKGSLVNDEYLRFDYSCDRGISEAQIVEVERLVRFHIRASHVVNVEHMNLEDAKAKGAMALFEDKYQGKVRVLSMGGFSVELCGGTHVKTTGEIGSFKIINETSIASGIRRIVALTGNACDVWIDQRLQCLDQAANSLNVPVESLVEKIGQLKSNLKAQEASLNTFKQKMAVNQAHELLDHIRTVEDKDILVLKLDHYDLEKLRVLADQLIQGYQKDLIVVIVAPQANNKNLIIVAVSKALMNLFSARDILKAVTKLTGGGGGGRSDFAQGAGPHNPELSLLEDLVFGWVKLQLENSH